MINLWNFILKRLKQMIGISIHALREGTQNLLRILIFQHMQLLKFLSVGNFLNYFHNFKYDIPKIYQYYNGLSKIEQNEYINNHIESMKLQKNKEENMLIQNNTNLKNTIFWMLSIVFGIIIQMYILKGIITHFIWWSMAFICAYAFFSFVQNIVSIKNNKVRIREYDNYLDGIVHYKIREKYFQGCLSIYYYTNEIIKLTRIKKIIGTCCEIIKYFSLFIGLVIFSIQVIYTYCEGFNTWELLGVDRVNKDLLIKLNIDILNFIKNILKYYFYNNFFDNGMMLTDHCNFSHDSVPKEGCWI